MLVITDGSEAEENDYPFEDIFPLTPPELHDPDLRELVYTNEEYGIEETVDGGPNADWFEEHLSFDGSEDIIDLTTTEETNNQANDPIYLFSISSSGVIDLTQSSD